MGMERDDSPPVLVTGAELKKPVKNRQMRTVCRSLAAPLPKEKMAATK